MSVARRKVVLVNPMVAHDGWGTYYRGHRRYCSLPHGLLSIATVLNQDGNQAYVVDLRQFSSMRHAMNEIAALAPDVVGVGAMSVDFGVACELLDLVSAELGAVTVLGGVHATLCPGDAEGKADFVIRGEADVTLPDMIDANFAADPPVQWGDLPDMDALPFIDRDLVDYRGGELATPYWKGKAPYVTMMAGRGCPFKCAFCAPVPMTVFRKVRQRSPDGVVAEMVECRAKYGAAYFDFIDDTFTLKRTWVEEFCNRYDASGLGVPFVIASRADIITANATMFGRLRRAGCDTVSVGFESGCDRVLKLLNKGTTREMNLEAARVLRRHGYKIVANVMYGVPTETVEEAMQTSSMVDEIAPDVISPAWFTPYPGCELHNTFRDMCLTTDYADMHRYPDKPKVMGVDYDAIRAVARGF